MKRIYLLILACLAGLFPAAALATNSRPIYSAECELPSTGGATRVYDGAAGAPYSAIEFIGSAVREAECHFTYPPSAPLSTTAFSIKLYFHSASVSEAACWNVNIARTDSGGNYANPTWGTAAEALSTTAGITNTLKISAAYQPSFASTPTATGVPVTVRIKRTNTGATCGGSNGTNAVRLDYVLINW